MGRPVGQVRLRVRYAETDQMGFAYYGAYAAWLEVGRVEFLRERGLAYRDLEAAGQYLAVRELRVEYLVPARYDDELLVRTTVGETGKSRVAFESEILRAEGETLLARAHVGLVCLDRRGRPRRVSPEVLRACAAN